MKTSQLNHPQPRKKCAPTDEPFDRRLLVEQAAAAVQLLRILRSDQYIATHYSQLIETIEISLCEAADKETANLDRA